MACRKTIRVGQSAGLASRGRVRWVRQARVRFRTRTIWWNPWNPCVWRPSGRECRLIRGFAGGRRFYASMAGCGMAGVCGVAQSPVVTSMPSDGFRWGECTVWKGYRGPMAWRQGSVRGNPRNINDSACARPAVLPRCSRYRSHTMRIDRASCRCGAGKIFYRNRE